MLLKTRADATPVRCLHVIGEYQFTIEMLHSHRSDKSTLWRVSEWQLQNTHWVSGRQWQSIHLHMAYRSALQHAPVFGVLHDVNYFCRNCSSFDNHYSYRIVKHWSAEFHLYERSQRLITDHFAIMQCQMCGNTFILDWRAVWEDEQHYQFHKALVENALRKP